MIPAMSVAPSRPRGEASSRSAERLAAVLEIGRALGRTFDLDTLLQRIMEKITELMKADRSTLFLVDRERGEIWSKVMQGTELREIRLKLGSGIVGHVAATGEVANIPDAYADRRFNPDVDRASGYRTRSILCAPMFDQRGEVIGAVECLNKEGGAFDQDDEALLCALVAQAAISIENSTLYQDLLARNRELMEAEARLRHKIAELDLLYEVERQISGARSLEEILQNVLEKACEVVGAEAGSVLLQDEHGEHLYFRAAEGPIGERLQRIRLRAGSGIAGQVARSGTGRIVNDVKADPAHDPTVDERLGFRTRNLVAVPLRVADRVIGTLELVNKLVDEAFSDDDLKLTTLIAGQASRAIAVSKAREEEARQERLSLIGQMVSGILHDLKTPMTVISGHAQLMALEDDPAARDAHVEAILKQFDHINGMAHEIMAFAKGKREILARRVYLHKFIAEVRELLRPEMESYRIAWVVEDRYRGAAYFDENKMKRVVANIARNACQAMSPGGTFTWTIDRPDEHTLYFGFSDTGPGIPAEMEGRLFDSFATHGKKDGTGLGLAIVKKIIDEHGGSIDYDSSPKGTTFHVRLPMDSKRGA
ncbi:MAG: GAF domain-containing protein [Deltaproteobacteria bacterium]|nr:MAG: GAF domain-containing protein [Deltaproteobacteria bacterium]